MSAIKFGFAVGIVAFVAPLAVGVGFGMSLLWGAGFGLLFGGFAALEPRRPLIDQDPPIVEHDYSFVEPRPTLVIHENQYHHQPVHSIRHNNVPSSRTQHIDRTFIPVNNNNPPPSTTQHIAKTFIPANNNPPPSTTNHINKTFIPAKNNPPPSTTQHIAKTFIPAKNNPPPSTTQHIAKTFIPAYNNPPPYNPSSSTTQHIGTSFRPSAPPLN